MPLRGVLWFLLAALVTSVLLCKDELKSWLKNLDSKKDEDDQPDDYEDYDY